MLVLAGGGGAAVEGSDVSINVGGRAAGGALPERKWNADSVGGRTTIIPPQASSTYQQ